MTIREAEESDVFGILEVLKASLGEESSKKNLEVWNYKHTKNPFGSSLVLIAENDRKIVGVRAFMRWEWRSKDRTFKSYRAVDTATHPDYQGKGIFKSLTLKALLYAEAEGGDFVFNTPNTQSKPGYLKMGWEEVGKLKVKLVPLPYFAWKSKYPDYQQNINWTEKGIEKLLKIYNNELRLRKNLYTPKSREFLEWRYLKCPLQKYRIEACDEYFIAGYVKTHSKFRELRISEIIIGEVSNKKLKTIIVAWAKEYHVQLITFSNDAPLKFFTSIGGNFGPSFTIRTIQERDKEIFDSMIYQHINKWSYSLGDLELF